MNDEYNPATYASPPCFMHELDDNYTATANDADAQLRTDIKRWRKAERERLIGERLAIPNEARSKYGERIAASLEAVIGDVSGLTISAY